MHRYPTTFNILLSLNSKECSKFKEYLNSPYFNKINTLPNLFESIIALNKANKNKFDEGDFLRKVYEKPTVRKYRFDLVKLKEHFERFIALKKFEENELNACQYILEDYLYREGGIYFEKKYEKVKNLFDEAPIDVQHYQNKYKLEELLDCYIKLYEKEKVGDTNLQAISDIIDLDFILKKICFSVLMLNRANVGKTEYNFGLRQFVLDHLKANPEINNPLIKQFYYAFEILSGNNKSNMLRKLNIELKNNNNNIAEDMTNLLCIILQNNLKRIDDVKLKLHNELWKLYDIVLGQKHAQHNGKLPVVFFKNIISIGLELGDFGYVEELLKKYKNKLIPADQAEAAYNYNKGKLFIYKGNPENAWDLVRDIQFKDAIHKLDFRCLEIMLYYDLKELSVLEYQINAFKVALTPNRSTNVKNTHIKVYRNFINIIKKMHLFQTTLNPNKDEIIKLVKRIEKSYQFANRKWLLMRANDLLKK